MNQPLAFFIGLLRWAIHGCRILHPQVIQDNRGEVGNVGWCLKWRTVHKKNSGYRFRIDDVISAPATGIVGDQLICETANCGLPRDPESGIKVHQQIGRLRSKGP